MISEKEREKQREKKRIEKKKKRKRKEEEGTDKRMNIRGKRREVSTQKQRF